MPVLKKKSLFYNFIPHDEAYTDIRIIQLWFSFHVEYFNQIR